MLVGGLGDLLEHLREMPVSPSQNAGLEAHVAVGASVTNAVTLRLNQGTGQNTYTAIGSIWWREGVGLEATEEASEEASEEVCS